MFQKNIQYSGTDSQTLPPDVFACVCVTLFCVRLSVLSSVKNAPHRRVDSLVRASQVSQVNCGRAHGSVSPWVNAVSLLHVAVSALSRGAIKQVAACPVSLPVYLSPTECLHYVSLRARLRKT